MKDFFWFVFLLTALLGSMDTLAMEQQCKGTAIMGISQAECAKCSDYIYIEDKEVMACVSCFWEGGMPISKDLCAKCPNRKMIGDFCAYCGKDQIFDERDGKCRSCSFKIGLEVPPDECAKCSNRQISNGRCVLKGCGSDQFLDTLGNCFSCDDEGHMILATSEECAKCPNRKAVNWRIGWRPVETLCAINCKEDYFLDIPKGKCRPCFFEDSILTTAEECNKCSNRVMKGNECKLKKENAQQNIKWAYQKKVVEEAKVSSPTSMANQADISGKVIVNSDRKIELPVCGTVRLSEACLYYVLNGHTHDYLAEDFFEEVTQKIQRSVYQIRRNNVRYTRMVIPPGHFAEIIVPALE